MNESASGTALFEETGRGFKVSHTKFSAEIEKEKK